MKQMHRQWCRLVFSKSLGRMIAFGEVVSSDGGASGGFLRLSLRASSLTSCLIGALAATPALTTPAWANPVLPEKGQIVSGGGTIGPSTGSDMVITQDGKKLIINWDKFNIGKDNRVTFNQPDANSIALNRVLGTEASNIAGTLSANGQVFLLNPNGVVFANGAQVNVAGLLASTLSMSDEDFNNGVYRLTSDPKGNGKAVITNNGSLTGGYIALVGDTVKNSGTIATPGGRAALAAGETVTLGINGSSLVSVTVDAQAARRVLLENSGTIRADNGTIQLTARGNNALTDLAINNTGTLEATGLSAGEGGLIVLEGDNGKVALGKDGTVNVPDAELKIATTGWVDIWGKGADQSTLAARKLDISGGQVNINSITVSSTSTDRGSIRADAPAGRNAFHVSGVRLKNLDVTATSDRGAVLLSTNVTLEDVTIKGTTTGNGIGVYADGTVTSDDKTTITGIATGNQDNRGVRFFGGRVKGGIWRAEADNGTRAAEFDGNVTTENITLHAENKGRGYGIEFKLGTHTNGTFTGQSKSGTGIYIGGKDIAHFTGDRLTLNGRGMYCGICTDHTNVDLSDRGRGTEVSITGVATGGGHNGIELSGFDLSRMKFVNAVGKLNVSSAGSARDAVNYMPVGSYDLDVLKNTMFGGIDNKTYFDDSVAPVLVDMLKESLAKAGNGDWNLDFSGSKSGGWSFDMANTVFNVKGNADIRGLMFNNATLNVDKNLTLGFAGQGVVELKNTHVKAEGNLTIRGDRVLLQGKDENNRSDIKAANATINGETIDIRDVNLTATQGDITVIKSGTEGGKIDIRESSLKAKNDLRLNSIIKEIGSYRNQWGAIWIIGSILEAGNYMELIGLAVLDREQEAISEPGGVYIYSSTLKAPRAKIVGTTSASAYALNDLHVAGVTLGGETVFKGLFDIEAISTGTAPALHISSLFATLVDDAKINIRATGESTEVAPGLGTVSIREKFEVKGSGEFNINATSNTSGGTVHVFGSNIKGDGKAKININAKNTGTGDGIIVEDDIRFDRPADSIVNVTLSGEAVTGNGIRFGAKKTVVENSSIQGTSQDGTGVSINEGVSLDGRTIVIGTGPFGKEVTLSPGVSIDENTVVIRRTPGFRISSGNRIVPPVPPSGGDTGILIPDTNVKSKYQTPDVVFRLVDRKINPEPTLEVCSEDEGCNLETTPAVFRR